MKKVTEENVKEIVKHMFPFQKIPQGFHQKLRDYINERLAILNCCSLYITDDTRLTSSFRNFLRDYPELDCSRREAIIYESGDINLIPDYRRAKRIGLNPHYGI